MNNKGKSIISITFFFINILLFTFSAHAETTIEKSFEASSSIGGGVGGSGTVMPDLFTGTMSYSVPIEVPAGRKGMQPNLSLTYLSSNGNGWVGVGWDLEVPAIERNARTGINYNGNNGDGNGYVLRVAGSTVDLVSIGNNEYRAKIEEAFLKIVKTPNSDGTPQYWDIYDKSGIHYTYGKTQYGSDEPRQYDPSRPAEVFKWYIDRVEDTNGNYMTYNYWKDQNQVYIDQINYAGNNSGLPTTNVVKFYWCTRTDAPEMYTTIFKITTAYRLSAIDMSVNGNHVRAYQLDYAPYSPSTGRSLLSKVQQFGKDSSVDGEGRVSGPSSFPAITFSWQDNLAQSGTFPPNYSWTSSLGSGVATLGDFNGDGKTDIYLFDGNTNAHSVWLNNGDGSFPATRTWQSQGAGYTNVLLGDFNGDGKTDIYMYNLSTGNQAMWLNNGDGTFPPTYTWHLNPGFGKGYSVLPGDFNGDGKPDIYMVKSSTGDHIVWLNNGDGTFPSNYAWHSGTGFGTDYAALLGDFNGDSKADIYMFKASTGDHIVWLNNEDGAGDGTFRTTTPNLYTWHSGTGYGTNYGTFLSDFNGDGKTDIYLYKYSTGDHFVWLNDGGGMFPTDATWYTWHSGAGYGTEYRPFPGDFNGDGKTDIYMLYTSQWSNEPQHNDHIVWLNNGDSTFLTGTSWYKWHSGPGYLLSGDSSWGICLNPPCPSLNATGAQLGDFNGDGKPDIFMYNPVGGTYATWLNKGSYPDLLSTISNGIGGTTTVAYTPSTRYVNTLLPFPLETVSSITTNDGNGIISTSTFTYEGGFYHIGERDFRGFNHVVVAGPSGANNEQKITETWFHQGTTILPEADTISQCLQHVYCKPCLPDTQCDCPNTCTMWSEGGLLDPVGYMKGKPYRTQLKDGSGNIYAETTISYLASSLSNSTYFNPPDTVTSLNCNGDSTIACDGITNGQSTKTQYSSYDTYGNAQQVQLYIAANASTPYRTTTTAFTTDGTDRYIVGLPKSEVIADSSGAVASSTTYYYDDTTDCSTRSQQPQYHAPTRGNLTAIVHWFKEKTTGTDPEVDMSYDINTGNLVCTRDPKGYVSRITYDSGTKTYATVKQNPRIQETGIQHSTTTNYYGVGDVPLATGVYGQVQSIIDPNNQSVSFEYDALGRKIKMADPYAVNGTGTISYSYNDNYIGNVGLQHVTTTTTLDYTTQAVLWSETYFDGFGRTVKARNQGANNAVFRADTSYDNRGAVLSSSLLYLEGSANIPTTTFKYDAIGRATQVTNPEGKILRACFLNGITATVDPDGHKKRETRDVFGRLVQVDEYASNFADCSTDPGTHGPTDGRTTYQYDVMGRLQYTTDAESNQTVIGYDSLGRKNYMNDPDMGIRLYSYDLNNNLISQTDAKNSTIQFVYDELNRVKSKNYPTGGSVTYTYDVAPEGSPDTYPMGRLSIMSDASGTQMFYYDKVGRTTRQTRIVDNNRYDFITSYDALGRPKSITYPDAETVNYAYNADVLSDVSGSGITYARFENYTAYGQPGTISYGNGVATSYTYDPTTHSLKSVVTGNAHQSFINLSYDYYPGGPIQEIIDNTENGTRTQFFWYDGLNRLQQAQLAKNGGTYDVLWYDYTPNGNLKLKEDMTLDYTAGASGGPHAVKSTYNSRTSDSRTSDSRTYDYDQNGNMTSESMGSTVYRTISYDYDNMPKSVIFGSATTSFMYDGVGMRVKKINSNGEELYLGKLYECREGTCTKYIFAGGTRIAMKAGTDVLYYHQDHLGSTLAVTDSTGNQTTSCSKQPVRIAGDMPQYYNTLQAAYDAALDGAVIQVRAMTFNEDLNLSHGVSITISGGYDCGFTSQVANSEIVGMFTAGAGSVTIRNFEIAIIGYANGEANDIQYLPFGGTRSDEGALSATHKYTAQEFDAETGLYNYNARFYNPLLGRFISADSIVPNYSDPQLLNRYSYARNNPLIFADSTGHRLSSIVNAFSYAAQIFISLYYPEYAMYANAAIGAGNAAAQSYWNGAHASGMLQSGLLGAYTGAVGGYVGGSVGGAVGSTYGNFTGAVAGGAAGGAASGAATAAATGGNVWSATCRGAAYGAATAAVIYEGRMFGQSVVNARDSYGFKTNESVMNSFYGPGMGQTMVNFAASRYGTAPGTYNPADSYFAEYPNAIANTDMPGTGEVTYSAKIMDPARMLRAGWHEGVHVQQYNAGFREGTNALEVDAEGSTIWRAQRLDLSAFQASRSIWYYNDYGGSWSYWKR